MTIYTRRGDTGETSLADGERVPKTDPRVEAYGTIDEANSAIGAARALTDDVLLRDVLGFAQQRLLNCSSHVATPPDSRTALTTDVDDEDVAALERAVDRFEEATGPLDHFLVPGGTPLSAQLHVARTVVRRAERRVAAIDPTHDGDRRVACFVNRLSDVLFAAARYALVLEGESEDSWDREAPRPLA